MIGAKVKSGISVFLRNCFGWSGGVERGMVEDACEMSSRQHFQTFRGLVSTGPECDGNDDRLPLEKMPSQEESCFSNHNCSEFRGHPCGRVRVYSFKSKKWQ